MQCFGSARAFVCGQIVQDHNGAGVEHGSELCFDVGVECRAVHRACDDPRRYQRILRQSRDECLRAPFAEWCGAVETFADRCPAPQSGEVRLHSGFVNEDQPVRFLAHARLPTCDPVPAGLPQRWPITFGCDQSFFYMKVPPV